MKAKIGIIVLNWNKPDLTIKTIDSLLKIKHSSFSYEIFLVDNGSSDDSLHQLSQNFSSNNLITLLTTNTNLGFVGGNNFAIKQILKENFNYILLINNDVLVDPEFLENLVNASKKNFSLVSPKIYFAPGYEYHLDRYSKKELGQVLWFAGGKMDWANIYGSHIGVDEVDHKQYDSINDNVDFLTGCCLLIKRQVFDQIGLLDERFFMYLEDADFCQRAKKYGFKMAYIPQSKIWHLNAGSSKSGGELHDYFISRNRLLFGFRYAKPKTKLALIKESLIKSFSPTVSKWQKIGIRDFYLNKFGKGSWQ